MWPAFWLMGGRTQNWPDRGEIDVMENIGKEPWTVHGTIHGLGYSGPKGISSEFKLPESQRFADGVWVWRTPLPGFHIYAAEWEPDAIRWYVDETL